MSLSMFLSCLLFVAACIPLLSFLAGVIVRLYFNEKKKFWSDVMNAASEVINAKMEELKNGDQQ